MRAANKLAAAAEGDMHWAILKDVNREGFNSTQIIMDHVTSGGNIACDIFPEAQITYYGNHTAKTYHQDLVKIPRKVNLWFKMVYFIVYAVLNTISDWQLPRNHNFVNPDVVSADNPLIWVSVITTARIDNYQSGAVTDCHGIIDISTCQCSRGL